MSKLELQLERDLWASRTETVKVAVRAIQAESQLLNMQARECQEHMARLDAAIKAEEERSAIPDQSAQQAENPSPA